MGLHGTRDKALRQPRRPRPSAKHHHQHHHHHHHQSQQLAADDVSLVLSPALGCFLDGEAPVVPPYTTAGWGYCTEEQLEEVLLRNLDMVYREALDKLVSLGYDEDLALRAVLRCGHCYGSMDALSNILHNALAHISTTSPASASDPQSDAAFSDLRHLVGYSLAGMVCLLQQMKPHLSRGDAMWCLLVSDLHVARATTIDVPSAFPAFATEEAFPEISGGEIEAECARRFGLPPSMESLLKRNVAAFAAGYRAKSRPSSLPVSTPSPQRSSSSLKQISEDSGGIGVLAAKDSADPDVVASVMSDLEKLNLGGEVEEAEGAASEDHRKEMIMDIIKEIRDLEEKLKDRTDWAHQKALQAARKMSSDLTELRTLRTEREDTLKEKNARQVIDEAMVKRLEEMEEALRKASAEVDRANETVHRLEIENKELKAEMAASKLSASESALISMEVAKREKKCMKRLAAWEKQKAEIQESILEEKRKIEQMQMQLGGIGKAQKELQGKCRREAKAKERAIALVEEEKSAKEAAEDNIRRSHDALRRKIELDFQRYKDDIQRLEDELARLRATAESSPVTLPPPSAVLPGDVVAAQRAKTARPGTPQKTAPRAPERPQASSAKGGGDHRECCMCKKDEVSVVFLPCAHQVLCASCNEHDEKRVRACCPCCGYRVEHRVRVFGPGA